MISRPTPMITPDELKERYGLEIYDDITGLTGERPERTIVKNQSGAEILGVNKGRALAMPPANPEPRDTVIISGQGLKARKWMRRVEGPHWQADLFIEAEGSEWGKPIYAIFDRLEEVVPQMKRAVEMTPPWREVHETMRKTIDRVLMRNVSNSQTEGSIGLHQRYG